MINNRFNSWYLTFVVSALILAAAMAETVNDLETLDGSQRNRLSTIISAIPSGGGGGGSGDVGAASNNVFTGVNTFNGPTTFKGNIVATNGVDGSVTNYFGSVRFYNRATDNKFFNLMTTNGTSVGNVTWDTTDGFQISTAGGLAQINFQNTLGQLNFMNGNYTLATGNFNIAAGVTSTFSGLLMAGSNLLVSANTTIGDGPARSVTFNANTATVVGQLNFNANTLSITNGSILLGAAVPPANLAAKQYVNGNIRADNYFYNILTAAYGANGTGTNTIDFSTGMLVNITNVTAGLTITSANLIAGRSVDIIFQGTTSNILLTLPTSWIPVSPTFSAVVTNKYVVVHAMSMGTTDANVLYTITQQP